MRALLLLAAADLLDDEEREKRHVYGQHSFRAPHFEWSLDAVPDFNVTKMFRYASACASLRKV